MPASAATARWCASWRLPARGRARRVTRSRGGMWLPIFFGDNPPATVDVPRAIVVHSMQTGSIRETNMLRVGMVGLAGMLAATVTAGAQSPVERGDYLVNGILTCGNCHTPRGPGGVLAMDKQLSGGPQAWDEPALQGDGLEHHARHGDRHRQAGARPTSSGRSSTACGRTACSSRRSCRTASTRSSPPRDLDAIVAYLRSVPAVSNKVPGAGLQGRASRRNVRPAPRSR